jgi:hypothetical protein
MDQSTSTGSILDSWNFGRRIEHLQVERNKLPSQVFSIVWTVFSVVVGDNKDPKKRSIKYRSELYDRHALIVLSDTCKLEPLSAT